MGFYIYNNMLISSLEEIIPVLEDAHKKTPIEPRIEKLENLLSIHKETFREREPFLAQKIFPIKSFH